MFQKFLLQHMKTVRLGEALHGLDFLALGLYRQHQAGAQRAAVDDYGTGAAVAGEASFFAAGKFEHIAQRLKHALARLAQELSRLTIDRCFDYYFLCHFRCRFNSLIKSVKAGGSRIALQRPLLPQVVSGWSASAPVLLPWPACAESGRR